MSFITTAANQIIIDAVLTKRGRELLASGQTEFNITKFALADDEIDYGTSGLENLLNDTPEQLPILEPIINGNLMMNSLLFTDPNSGTGRYVLPLISISGLVTSTANVINGGIIVTYTPSTLNTAETYQIKVNGGKYALKDLFEQLNGGKAGKAAASGTFGRETLDTAITFVGQSAITLKILKLTTAKTFSITVTGQQTGASVVYSFTISPTNIGFGSGTGAIVAS